MNALLLPVAAQLSPASVAAAAAQADRADAGMAGAVAAPVPVPATITTASAPVQPQHSPASPGNLGGAVFALVLVVGLILLLSWLARRMPGLGGRGANPALRIVGSLALGPRDRLVVVEIGATQLLLGVGAGGTRTLHTLDQPLPTLAAKPAPAFAQVLAQHFGKKTP
ncbi:flagellar biosynthetic protein FliO [Luteimonas sp. MJ246]|uniref:flagellar biosynthetic protein FliO n=1 Tax=Luteimonas sp. MJ174 TaxID=3129237 RepID=UPI0031BA2EF1